MKIQVLTQFYTSQMGLLTAVGFSISCAHDEAHFPVGSKQEIQKPISHKGVDCHQMETAHAYGRLRFIVSVEGKKGLQSAANLPNHPFTL